MQGSIVMLFKPCAALHAAVVTSIVAPAFAKVHCSTSANRRKLECPVHVAPFAGLCWHMKRLGKAQLHCGTTLEARVKASLHESNLPAASYLNRKYSFQFCMFSSSCAGAGAQQLVTSTVQ